MNPENNGNRLKEIKPEGPIVLEDREPSFDAPPSPEPLKDASASPTWATRVDALNTVATNRKPMVMLGAGLGAAVLLFVLTSFFGKTPSKKEVAASQNNAQTSTASKSKGSVTPLMETVHTSATSDTAGQVTPADISRTKSSSSSHTVPPSTQTAPTRSTATSGASLASVPPFESTQQHWEEPKPYGDQQTSVSPPVGTGQANLLKEASLVFVKKTEQPGFTSLNTNKASESAPS